MPPLIICHVTHTIRPADRDGDRYFGLEPGSNGTAATCRRALVQPLGFRWLRSSGRAATGPLYVPGQTSEAPFFQTWWHGVVRA